MDVAYARGWSLGLDAWLLCQDARAHAAPATARPHDRRAAVAVRVAVVGLGYWGPNLVRNLNELPEAEVVAVCDLEPRRCSRGSRPATGGLRTHRELRRRARRRRRRRGRDRDAGLDPSRAGERRRCGCGKHVFVEKPLAASLDAGARAAAPRAERGLVLMPGHTFLYSPPVNMIRELIESGELGEIYFISTSRVNLGLHQSDVSVVWDLGPHDFSILRYWLDEAPTHVSALSPRLRHAATRPTSRSSTCEYASGTIAQRRALVARSRASCAGRRSSARARWSSTTTRATSRCASSTRA